MKLERTAHPRLASNSQQQSSRHMRQHRQSIISRFRGSRPLGPLLRKPHFFSKIHPNFVRTAEARDPNTGATRSQVAPPGTDPRKQAQRDELSTQCPYAPQLPDRFHKEGSKASTTPRCGKRPGYQQLRATCIHSSPGNKRRLHQGSHHALGQPQHTDWAGQTWLASQPHRIALMTLDRPRPPRITSCKLSFSMATGGLGAAGSQRTGSQRDMSPLGANRKRHNPALQIHASFRS